MKLNLRGRIDAIGNLDGQQGPGVALRLTTGETLTVNLTMAETEQLVPLLFKDLAITIDVQEAKP